MYVVEVEMEMEDVARIHVTGTILLQATLSPCVTNARTASPRHSENDFGVCCVVSYPSGRGHAKILLVHEISSNYKVSNMKSSSSGIF
jgi:hypothetical protein